MDRFDLIDKYLSDLSAQLGGRGQYETDALDECRDHLHLAAEALIAQGATAAEAQMNAIVKMGSVDDLASGIRHQSVRRATVTTRVSGLFGMAGSVALLISVLPTLFLVVMTGSRPNVTSMGWMTSSLFQLCLVVFLAGLVLRSAPATRKLISMIGVIVPAVLSVGNFGLFWLFTPFNGLPAALAILAIGAVALTVVLRPWSADGFGPAWTRIALCAGVLAAGAAMLTDSLILSAAEVFLIVPASVCLGQQLWAERNQPRVRWLPA